MTFENFIVTLNIYSNFGVISYLICRKYNWLRKNSNKSDLTLFLWMYLWPIGIFLIIKERNFSNNFLNNKSLN